MNLKLQTILGSGGGIGTNLAKELSKYTTNIRLVSRNPKSINPEDELFPADLTDALQVDKAVQGSDIVYLTVGFEYNVKVWKEQWPKLMQNVIDACEKHHARLVFFDNIYAYDPDFLNGMTEETPIRPISKKGEIRAQILKLLLDEMKNGHIKALIARAADFIGPKNSLSSEMIYKNFKKGKRANWLADISKVHNFTFTPDAAFATALLGNTPDAFGQTWHLPSDNTALTGKDWIQMFAKEMHVEPKIMVIPVWMLGILGIFVPILKEFKEMAYQYNRNYLFVSSKFEKRFGFKSTSPQEAVKKTVQMLDEISN
jgi:nucleoside-diphosphate-sugar epimerase